MQLLNKEVITGLFFLFLSSIALWESKDLSLMSSVFPRTVGTILFFLSMIYIISSIKNDPENEPFKMTNKWKVWSLSLGMVVYLGLIWTLGFFIASLVFMGYFTWSLQSEEEEVTNSQKLIKSMLWSISASGVFYFLFRFVFSVPLPNGIVFGG